MDSNHLNQPEKTSSGMSSDLSLSDESPATNGIFGDPLLHPRVGGEYQAQIPLLSSKYNPSSVFSLGLTIPITWVCNQTTQVNHESTDEKPMAKTSETSSYFIVPGIFTNPWSDFETDWFLLGLYFFGKDLQLVSRFMDGKNMGEILSFYYSKFYRSPAYCKWSECRKMRNKKCVIGHRFFTGYRQHELCSRLLPHLSDESKTNLLEASRDFADGRRTLEEYVSTLKNSVGIHLLVGAVAIGRGKDDLTTLVIDNTKNNQLYPNRPEIPSGKACSSLTSTEIVNFLTGDYRLSKARSNDLFWEAVWPRLLARGWHSEQPWGEGVTGGKNSLVFLIPGVKKFSRRKLTKGEHYFDSVSDVLAKVASQPELLELDTDETRLNVCKEESGWAMDVGPDDDQGSDDYERHCYLKPRLSTVFSNIAKFTVVDTSLASEDYPYKIRELRNLPLLGKKSSKISRRSSKSEVNSMCNDAVNDAKGGLSDIGESQSSQKNHSDHDTMSVDVSFRSDYKHRPIKLKFSRRVKSGLSNCSVQEPRKQELGCDETVSSCVLSSPAKKKNRISVDVSETIFNSFSGTHEIKLEKQGGIDLNLPRVNTEADIDEVRVKVEEQENTDDTQAHSDVVKPNDVDNCGVHRHSVTILPDDAGLDTGCGAHQLPRRQSTRNRPLTTKALEALEIGFLKPVGTYRKRCPSKRSRQLSNRSGMISGIKILEDRGFDGTYNEKPNMVGDPHIGSIAVKKEVASSNLVGLCEFSCSEEP